MGIGRRVAELWGFCGFAGALTGPADPTVPRLSEPDDPFPSNPASPERRAPPVVIPRSTPNTCVTSRMTVALLLTVVAFAIAGRRMD